MEDALSRGNFGEHVCSLLTDQLARAEDASGEVAPCAAALSAWRRLSRTFLGAFPPLFFERRRARASSGTLKCTAMMALASSALAGRP